MTPPAPHVRALAPAFSLYRAPVALRLAGVAAVLAALWAGVWWAAA